MTVLTPWTREQCIAFIQEEHRKAEMKGGVLRRGEVEEIRDLYASGEMKVEEIASRYGITRSTVTNAALGHNWGYPPLKVRKGGRTAA